MSHVLSALIRIPKAPQYQSCFRPVFEVDRYQPVISPFRTQVRGKKKVKAPTTLNVKLLKDIKGYGRKGSIVPVAPGRMRNIWFPNKRAEYMTQAQLKSLNMGDTLFQRDFGFGMERTATDKAVEEARVPDVPSELLPPKIATEIISSRIPDSIDFFRKPITVAASDDERNAPRPTSSSPAASPTISSPTSSCAGSLTAIFGSVSTADIAARIQALLGQEALFSEVEEVARVVLGPEDVRIVRPQGAISASGGETDRIKTLGEFEIYIQVKGGESIRRKVQVKAQA